MKVKITLNSWYLKVEESHHFFCKCGQHDSVKSVEPLMYHPWHTCSHCKNVHYLDTNAFVFGEKVLYWSKVYWSYRQQKNEDGWSVSAEA